MKASTIKRLALCVLLVAVGGCMDDYRQRWSDFVASVKVGQPLIVPDEFSKYVRILEDRPEYTKYLINTDANHSDIWVCIKNGKVVSIWAEKWCANGN